VKPAWFGTPECDIFMRDVLENDPLDIVRKFEQWACTTQKSECLWLSIII